MLFTLLYVVVCVLLEALIVRGRSDARLRAEVLALRHQLGVLERQVGRPRWQPDAEVCRNARCVNSIRGFLGGFGVTRRG